MLDRLKDSLIKKGYDVVVCESSHEAAQYLNTSIDGTTVGIGGSVTVKQIGLYQMLASHNEVYWHNQKPDDMTDEQTRRAACASNVYISSVNGIASTGEIVNIDYTGNRVAAISYGPREVYLIVGKNKVEETLEDAIYRARNVASPLNAKRLNRKTPCAVMGDKCYNCNSPDRICCNLSVLLCRPAGNHITVVLVNENLGY